MHPEPQAQARTSGTRLGRATSWLREHPWWTFALGCALEVGFSLVFRATSERATAGLPGAVGVLIAILAALACNTLVGASVAAVGGLAFVAVGRHSGTSLPSTLLLVVVWVVAAVLAGIAAQRLRARAEQAATQLRSAKRTADEVNVTLERILQTAPAFHTEGTTTQVAEAICTAARETFGCDSASLWRVVDGCEMELVLRRPAVRDIPPGTRFALPDDVIAAVIARRHASFTSAELADGTAEPARSLAVRSILRVPIVLGGEVTQILGLGWEAAVAEPEAETLVVVQRFADQAAFALEGARRREAQREADALHKRLQTGLLPTLLVRDASLHVATRYEAGEDRLLLGGDLYDAVELGDGALAVLIGDVSGHGPDAAALGANLRAAWRALVLHGVDAETLVRSLQGVLERERQSPEMFVTACLLFVEPDRHACSLVLAGHPEPVLLGVHDVRLLSGEPGPPLGMLAQARWRVVEHVLPDTWAILLYTDGLTDARVATSGSRRLGSDGLLAELRAVGAEPATLLGGGLDRLLERVRAAGSDRFADDVAILLVAYGV